MKPTLLIAIHGVELGEIENSFADKLFNGVKDNMPYDQVKDLNCMAYNWTTYTHPRQMQIYNAVESGLKNQRLRKLKHTIGSDIAWTVGIDPCELDCFMGKIYLDLKVAIENYTKQHEQSSIVVFGHSQGGQIGLNFVSDNPGYIDCLITAGSPIVMKSGRYIDWGKVPSCLKKWVNIYNRYDFISSKIQGCHPSKNIADFVEDFEAPIKWWQLLKSHTMYWDNSFVHKTISKIIGEIL
jgi:hypothetical protein